MKIYKAIDPSVDNPVIKDLANGRPIFHVQDGDRTPLVATTLTIPDGVYEGQTERLVIFTTNDVFSDPVFFYSSAKNAYLQVEAYANEAYDRLSERGDL